MKARTPSMVVFSTLTCSRSIIPGMFFMVAAAPASATGFHSSPVFGSTFQLVRSGAPMILANCGLTVVGTGTDRAGTSSGWAWAVVSTSAVHNSVAVHNFVVTAVEFPAAGCFIALPCSVLVLQRKIATMRARRSPCNPTGLQLFPNESRRFELLDPDIRVLDHLAPAFFLAAHIAVELRRLACDHHQALIDAELFERIGLNRAPGGFVQALDDLGRRFGRRI